VDVVYFDIETLGEHADPWNGKIITIQIRMNRQTIIWKEWELGEKGVIKAFFEFLEQIKRKETLFVGYCPFKKDIPCLNVRMKELGIWNKRREQILCVWLNWQDLYQFLGAGFMKFKAWLKTFKITKEWKGEAPSKLYREKRFDELEDYIQNEMESLEELYKRLKDFKEIARTIFRD